MELRTALRGVRIKIVVFLDRRLIALLVGVLDLDLLVEQVLLREVLLLLVSDS